MSDETFLNNIRNTTPPLATLILLFKYSTSKSPLLIFAAVFFKLYGLIIHSSNFVHTNNALKKDLFKETFILRQITLFELVLKNCSMTFYQILCFLIYIIEISFAVYLIVLYVKIKRRKFTDLTIPSYIKFCFYFNMLFSQHILELLAFLMFSFLRFDINISSTLYDDSYSSIPMISHIPMVEYVNLIYFIINIIVYIFINCILYYTFYVLNSPLYKNTSPMRYRHLSQSLFSVICQIVYSFHYLEIFLSGMDYALLAWKIIIHIMIILPILYYFLSSIKNFEFYNWLGWFTKMMLLIALFSGILEIFVSFGNHELDYLTVIIIFAIKYMIAVIFTWVYYYFKYRALKIVSTDSLFSLSEESWPQENIESFAYLIHLLNSIPNNAYDYEKDKKDLKDNRNVRDLVSIILEHEKNCSTADCECKIVKVFPHTTSHPQDFQRILSKRIGFLIETTFIRCEVMTKFDIALLLSEYYSIIKKNSFIAYSMLQSFLGINKNKMTVFQFIDLYSLQRFYIENCKVQYQTETKYVKFSILFNETKKKRELKKSILLYCENFTKMINMKEGIETSIKIDNDDNGELKSISSKYLSGNIINKIVNIVIEQGKLFRKIYHDFIMNKMNSGKTEYYYQMHIFFSFFKKNIGTKIKTALNYLYPKDKLMALSDNGVHNRFEDYLQKYFKNNKKQYFVMIKCNKGFTIKYFSSELRKLLNFNQSSIIGEPFDSIFPPDFREIHKKAMIRELNKSKYWYQAKTSYIFDSSGYSFPCKLRSSFMPHFCKSLVIITEITLKSSVIESIQSFILNRHYDLVALSKNLETHFALSRELIKKCEIDILEIFEISRSFLQKQFEPFTSQIAQFNEALAGDTMEIFSRWFFIPKVILDESMDVVNKKAKLRQCANTMKTPLNEIKRLHKDISRKRTSVLQNIVKILTRYSEIDLQEETLRKFTHSFHQFQSTYSAASISNKGVKNNDNLSYTIRIDAKCMYNIPFYYFSFQLQHETDKDLDLTIDTISEPKEKTQTKRILKESIMPSGPVNMNNNFHFGNSYKTFTQYKDHSLPIIIRGKTKNEDIKNDKHEFTWTNIINTSATKIFFLISVLFGFTISLALILFEKSSFFDIENIIATIDANNYERDALNQLFSSYLTFVSHLTGVSETNYPKEVYYNLLYKTILQFQDSFKLFYSRYMEYCIFVNKKNNELEELYPFIAIVHNWQNYSYESDYASEINKMLYLGMKVVNEPIDYINHAYDLSAGFQKKYLLDPQQPLRTYLGQFGFFVINNLQKLYTFVHGELFALFIEEADYFRTKHINLNWILEIIIYIYYLSFFVFFFEIIRRINNNVFGMIIEMFLYSEKNKTDTIKNTTGNLLLTQKIHLYCEIVKNFNQENCNELHKKQKERLGTIPDDSYMNTSQSIITGGNGTNNSTLNHITNASFIPRHTSLIKKSHHKHESLISLAHQEKKGKTKEHENLWTTRAFVKYFEVKHLWLLLFFKILTVISLLVCILFSVLRLLSSYDYVSKMNLIQLDFDYFTGKYTLLFTLFNNIRLCLLDDIKNFKLIGNFDSYMSDLLKNQDIFMDVTKYFPLTGELQHQTTLKNTDKDFNITVICGEEIICKEIVLLNNSYCSDGIEFGMNTILQKYFQIIKDFALYPYDTITREEILQYFTVNNMPALEKTVDFVLIRVQRLIYDIFRIDSDNLRRNAEAYVYIMNITTMITTVIIMVCFILTIYVKINTKYIDFSKEVSKLNYALFNYTFK